jgi:cell division protein FtsW
MDAWKRLEGAGVGLIGCVIALAVIGLVTAVSAAPPGEAWLALARHGIFLSLGLGGFVIAFSLSTEAVRRLVIPAMAALFVLLWLMLVTPLGHTANSATRWIQVGSLSLQPSILFQCLWPVALASWASRDPLRLRDIRQIAKLAAIFFIMILPVLLQPDLGSVVILMFVSGVTFFFAGTPTKFLAFVIPVVGGLIWAAAQFFPHVAARLTWLDQPPEQVQAAHKAFSLGGIAGLGPGNGLMKFGKIPESDTDFVLPLVAEEWGMLGTLCIWVLFVTFTFLGFRVARSAASRYGVILMGSATVMISFQAAYNMAMVTGLLPVKGLPLPFVSRGGSSILALSMLLGVALKACCTARRRRPEVTDLFS